MIRSEIREEVRERIGERIENFWKDTFINRAIQRGNIRFNKERRWPWLLTVVPNISVVVNTTELIVNDDVDPSRHFGLLLTPTSGDTKIRRPKRVSTMSGIDLRTKYSHSVAPPNQEPAFYYLARTQHLTPAERSPVLRLVPKADKAYTAEYFYYRIPDAMVTDADEPDMPEAYHDAVISWATAQCWKKELNGDSKAQTEFNEYNAVLEQATKDFKDLPEDEIVRWGGEEIEYHPPFDFTDFVRGRIGQLG